MLTQMGGGRIGIVSDAGWKNYLSFPADFRDLTGTDDY
jgi:hypothetical protein